MNNVVSINVNDIVVPEDVHYIGDWKEYRLEDYPFPHILNKVLTGCGYTEFCLGNWQNIILLSPRKFLLENKREQHLMDINIYYAENNIERLVDYELDISKETKALKNKVDTEEEINIKRESIRLFKEKISEHWRFCQSRKLPCKILVTYDSFRHVMEALGEDIKNFQIVVDEFQSIFIDARFKSEAELELVNHLQTIQSKYGVQRICYVSATPMLEKYLVQLDEFKDLPYFRLDWGTACPGRIKKPRIDIKYTDRPLSESVNYVIQKYHSGKFEMRMIDRGRGAEKIISNEAVLFFNSVKGICQAIRTNKLDISECNVLCANTPENQKKIRDAFNDVIREKQSMYSDYLGKSISKTESAIGSIPLKGEPHKMFTFCTRTVYLGADFYSTNARTFIFSDSNVSCLSVDISLDLEQILGRQRLDENPWKNSATLYVKTTNKKRKMTEEFFQSILNQKISESESLLRSYENAEEADKHDLAKNYQRLATTYHYKDNYVAVNEHGGNDLKPVFNKLMMLSEVRAFEVQKEEYADRFTVLNTIEGRDISLISDNVKTFANVFSTIGQESKKLEYIVEFLEAPGNSEKDCEDIFEFIDLKYKDYFNILGKNKIRALSYKEARIKRELLARYINSKVSEELINEIYKTFYPGSRYSNTSIIEALTNIYNRVGYTDRAQAKHLELYFNIKKIKLFDDEKKKWIHGLEILSKKVE